MLNKILPLSSLKEKEQKIIYFLPKELRIIALIFFTQLRELKFEKDDIAKNVAELKSVSRKLRLQLDVIKAGLKDVSREDLQIMKTESEQIDRKLGVVDFDQSEFLKRIEENEKLYKMLNRIWEAMFTELEKTGRKELDRKNKKDLARAWKVARVVAPNELKKIAKTYRLNNL